ncbi:Dyp-type peroxidase [Paracoccus aminovorans]|uniref:Dyp-type peroxidase n=1 Tax=Paracoccus aminovorans TaxID=34004 RepID=UPI002B25B5D5|nr:Dyp-type peroxidase [Paracoccus aminovorans]
MGCLIRSFKADQGEPIASQPADASLTANAIFLTLSLHQDDTALAVFRDFCADLPSLVRAVGFRSAEAGLSCVLGLGSGLWDRLGMGLAPAGLHPFREVAGVHRAPATPGDILFHIRAERPDYCFELASQIMRRLGPVATVEDETQGFKFFDNRDLLGFVDGTENPQGADRTAAVAIGDEDPAFAGGSYVIVQKYLHDLAKWEAMPVESQERVIGLAGMRLGGGPIGIRPPQSREHETCGRKIAAAFRIINRRESCRHDAWLRHGDRHEDRRCSGMFGRLPARATIKKPSPVAAPGEGRLRQ